MKYIQRKYVDTDKTGRNLQLLREHNIELRRSVCEALKRESLGCQKDCADCKFEMDNHISRKELADVFGVSENIIFNWESGRTMVDYENLLLYAQLSKLAVDDIVILSEEKNEEANH